MTTGCYFFPLTLERDVEIVVEESVHYVQGDPGGANDEWWECGEPKGEPVSTVREASAPLAGRSYRRCITQTLPRTLPSLLAQATHELPRKISIPTDTA